MRAMVFYEIVDRGVHVSLIHTDTSTTRNRGAQPQTNNHKRKYKGAITNTQPQRHIHNTQPPRATTATTNA